jgi:hypothetical protein
MTLRKGINGEPLKGNGGEGCVKLVVTYIFTLLINYCERNLWKPKSSQINPFTNQIDCLAIARNITILMLQFCT